MNLLIVEDDPITRRRIQHFVEKWDHVAMCATNGLEGLSLFIANRIDIVITDWRMPEMDGLTLARHIKERAVDAPYVYIILLTAKNTKSDIVEGLSRGGADDYITKPFDPDELRARIHVGARTVQLERTLSHYNRDLERLVRDRTEVIRRVQQETLMRILDAVGSRCGRPAGEAARISRLSALLAEAAGWPEGKIAEIRLAAPMLDIGTLGVADRLLNASGSLPEDEANAAGDHTLIGARMLSGSQAPILQMAHDIALHHHEHWDGTGHPHGLSGERIPASARIVGIVDAFARLTAAGAVSAGMTAADRIEAMSPGRGSRFDPYLFDLFIDRIGEMQ